MIINMLFVGGLVVYFGSVVYWVVKYGVIGLIKVVVLELVMKKVCVNVLCLGGMMIDMFCIFIDNNLGVEE